MNRSSTRGWMSLALAFLVVGGGLALAGDDDASSKERLGLIVEIGDQRIETFAGETFTVEIAGTTVPVRITPKATKQFQNAGVSFEYPRAFSMELDKSNPGVRIWTLDGNDVVLMVQEYLVDGGLPSQAGEVAKYMVQAYGPENAKRKTVSIELGGKKLAGHRIEARIAGQRLTQELFDLPSKGRPRVLLVQDSPKDDGSPSDEMRRTRELLTRTFRID